MKLSALTPELQGALDGLPPRRSRAISELRLRRGQNAAGVYPWGEELLTLRGRPIPVTAELLKTVLDRATGFSPYATKLEETGLYLPLEGGCRLGLCGEAVIRDGRLWGLRHISSLVVRLAREVPGVAETTAEILCRGGSVHSAVILSPPGGGKTTFLRDLIRCLSKRGYRVSVADQRRELGAQSRGENGLDLGPCTDLLSGCPKEEAMELLLRVMNPQVLAVDELWGEGELRAAEEAAASGVALLCTAHAGSLSELKKRPGLGQLLTRGVLHYAVELEHYQVKRMEWIGDGAEAGGRDLCGRGVPDERVSGPAGAPAAAQDIGAAAAGSGALTGGNGAPYGLAAGAL